MNKDISKAALDYHRAYPPGKLEIAATKPLANQHDLALAYSPGVAAACESPVPLVLTELRGERIALTADRVVGQQEIYVKPVPELLSGLRALAGLTILGDGRPMFLLDLNQIAW